MSLDHILLGLCRAPSSGYDLKAVFDIAIRHFWPAKLSQVYPALRHLERRRLLESRVVPSDRGPKRRVYHTTAAGRAALRAWLARGPAFRDERYVFGAQVFLLDALGDLDRSAAFVRQLRDALVRRRTALDALNAETPEGGVGQANLDLAEFHHHLCLRLGLRVLDARIGWCGEAFTEIARRRARARRRGRTRR